MKFIYTVKYFDGRETQKEKGRIEAPNELQAYHLIAQEFTTHESIEIEAA